jgi:hypothetical protein
VIVKLNRVIWPVSPSATSRTNSLHVPDAGVPGANELVMSRPATAKSSADPPARSESVAVWPSGATTWTTRSPRYEWVMLAVTRTFWTTKPRGRVWSLAGSRGDARGTLCGGSRCEDLAP